MRMGLFNFTAISFASAKDVTSSAGSNENVENSIRKIVKIFIRVLLL
jgi:hypothetical protein